MISHNRVEIDNTSGAPANEDNHYISYVTVLTCELPQNYKDAYTINLPILDMADDVAY